MKDIKQLLDEVFVISRIIKVKVGVISLNKTKKKLVCAPSLTASKASELDMITLRNHAPRSYTT